MLDNRYVPGHPALADDLEWFRRIADAALDIILVIDPDTTLRYVNPAAERVLGWRPDELVGRRGLEFVHPDDISAAIAALAGGPAAPGAERMQVRVRAKDGTWRHVEGLATDLLEDPVVHGMVVHVRDITDRVLAEEAARTAELRFRTLVEHVPAAVYVQTVVPARGEIYMSPQIEQITGWSPEAFDDPEFWGSCIHPDDRRRALELDERTDETGEPFSLEYRIIGADGRVVWLHDEAVLVETGEGRPMWQGVLMDITPRKEAEHALRESLARFETLVQRAPAGIYETDADGACIWVNRRGEEILGRRPSEVLGFRWVDLLYDDDRQRVTDGWRHATRAGTEYDVECRIVRPDGGVRWVHGVSTPIHGDGNHITGYLGTLVDVSEAKIAEQMLQESVSELTGSVEVLQRTEAERRSLLESIVAAQDSELGRMAEDIVDDPIQKLTAVGMRLEAFRRGLSDPDQLGALDELGDTVTQATQRLRRLLFELRPRSLDADGLAAAIREYLERTHRDADPSWSVEDRLVQEADTAIRSAAYRIVQEAVTNVREHAKAAHLWIALEEFDGGLRVQIVDDGMGFDVPARPGPGRMGLAGMRERARLAGGRLELHSAAGAGTTVDLWLPHATVGDPEP